MKVCRSIERKKIMPAEYEQYCLLKVSFCLFIFFNPSGVFYYVIYEKVTH